MTKLSLYQSPIDYYGRMFHNSSCNVAPFCQLEYFYGQSMMDGKHVIRFRAKTLFPDISELVWTGKKLLMMELCQPKNRLRSNARIKGFQGNWRCRSRYTPQISATKPNKLRHLLGRPNLANSPSLTPYNITTV